MNFNYFSTVRKLGLLGYARLLAGFLLFLWAPISFGDWEIAVPGRGVASQGSFTPMAATLDSYSATDTTPELEALATGLNKDPLKIFNYVRNKIEFQPYFGSHKGAYVTYLDGAGNDMDQASLLIALLKQCNTCTDISYVYGQCDFRTSSQDGVDLDHWLGVKPTIVANCLAFNGFATPVDPRFDHVWVRAKVNGTVYDLDPSFKLHQSFDAISELETKSGYNRTELLGHAGGAGYRSSNTDVVHRGDLNHPVGDVPDQYSLHGTVGQLWLRGGDLRGFRALHLHVPGTDHR